MILIVEDSKIQRTKIRSVLTGAAYEVTEAMNGTEALKVLEDSAPDLIMTDLLMPEMDGIQFLEELKKREIGIPVVVLSADIQDSTKERCYELGARAFVNKPIVQTEILPIIQELLGGVA